MVSHQGGCTYGSLGGLSSCSGLSLIRVGFHQGDPSSWSFLIRVVSHQGGLSSGDVLPLSPGFIVAMFSVGNHCCLLPQAVSKMFKELQWEKIVIVYGDDAYGVGGYQEVLRAAYEAEVCVSGAISVPHLGPDSEYEEKLRNIASYGATAAVFFGNPTDAISTMKVSC